MVRQIDNFGRMDGILDEQIRLLISGVNDAQTSANTNSTSITNLNTGLFKIGVLTAPAPTGDYAVTGVGFQPKLVIFVLLHDYRATGTEVRLSWGAATGSGDGNQFVTNSYSNSGTTAEFHSDQYCISNWTGVDNGRAQFTSMDSDGFTVDFTTSMNGLKIAYIAMR